MKKLLMIILAFFVVAAAVAVTIKMKPGSGDSGSQTEQPAQSDNPGDGELKITFDCTEFKFTDLEKKGKRVTGVTVDEEIVF